MAILSWSHSRLVEFNKCKRRAWLLYDQRVPEPQRPLPAGKTEHANDRGTRIHQSCEDYVSGKTDVLCPEAAKHFETRIHLLRLMYAEGLVQLEGEWGVNKRWEPCGWNGDWVPIDQGTPTSTKLKKLPERGSAGEIVQVGKQLYLWEPSWLRLKLDAIVLHSDTVATVIDHKSGRKFGNEVKHAEQTQLYQLVAFSRFPKLETVYTELWYIDQNEVTVNKFTRAQGLRFKPNFDKQGHAITDCVDFPPRPNVFSCQYCSYGPWGTGHCPDGVKK